MSLKKYVAKATKTGLSAALALSALAVGMMFGCNDNGGSPANGDDDVTFFCPEDCAEQTGASQPPHCFTTQPLCEASLPPQCTSGTDCPDDVGSCTASGTCADDVKREDCDEEAFVVGETCPITPPNGNGHGHFNPAINYGSFTDTRDGKSYRTVVIGGVTWMAENLNHQTENSWCYDNDPANCALYGRLYNWAAAMDISQNFVNTLWNGNDADHQGICPAGWRVPSDADWSALVAAVGSSAGTKLKSQTGWGAGTGTDEFGFSALPGGRRTWSGGFYSAGWDGYWWNGTEGTEGGVGSARHREMNRNDLVNTTRTAKANALSVRCVRD